jgi:hypothetical protein
MAHILNCQGSAVVGILPFLGTCFALLVGLVTMIYLLAAQKVQFARVLLLFMVAGVGLYVATLFAFTLR